MNRLIKNVACGHRCIDALSVCLSVCLSLQFKTGPDSGHSKERVLGMASCGALFPLNSHLNLVIFVWRVDENGYYLITCKTGGGPVWTCDSVVSVWSDCL